MYSIRMAKVFQNAQNPDNTMQARMWSDWNTYTLLVGMQNDITHSGRTVEPFLMKLSMY